MGDEINWECLLEGVPSAEELHFVSGDGDYASSIFPEELNIFLKSEWKQKKNAEICFYRSITDFFKKKFPDIKLASDIKVNKLIEKLAASGSFAMTHVVISELSKQAQFSKVQAEELIGVLDLNTQVSWIIDDLDVKTSYKSIFEKYGEIVSAPAKQTLTALLFPEQEAPAVDEEIPFQKPPPKGRQLFRSSLRELFGERGCGNAHKGRFGVDTRSGAGLAHGGPCGDPQHGNSGEIGPSCPCQPSDVLRPVVSTQRNLHRLSR